MNLRRVLIVVILFGLTSGLSILSMFRVGDPFLLAMWALLLFIPLGAVSVYFLETPQNRTDIFHPCYILLGATIFHFAGPSVYNYRSDWFPTDDEPYLMAHYMIMLGIFCILTGFFLAPVRRQKRITSIGVLRSPSSKFLANGGIIALLGISLGSSAYLVKSQGGIGDYMSRLGLRMSLFEGNGWLLSLTLISISATIIAYVQTIFHPRDLLAKLLLAISLVAALVTTTLSGSRANLVVVVLILLITRHRAVKPIKILTGGAALVVLFSIVFGYIALVRQATVSSDLQDSEGVHGKASFIYQTLFGKGTFIELNSVARTLEGVPDRLPYQYGSSYSALFTFPIPRAIIPNKMAGTSELYTRALRPEIWAAGRGDRVTFFGESLINFGIPGLMVGSLLLGILARFVYSRCNNLRNNPYYSVFCGFFILWLLIVYRGDVAIATWSVLRVCLPVIVVYLIIKQPSRLASTKKNLQPAAAVTSE